MNIPRALTGWKREKLDRRRDRTRYRRTPRIEGLEGRALLSVLTVMNNNDDGPGSLRAEVGAAAAGDVITFAPQLDGQTITLESGAITPQYSITIEGPDPNLLAISGNNASGIFDLAGTSLSISGLTLEDGLAKWGAAISQEVASESINVSDCHFTGNHAQTPDGTNYPAFGGAIASPGPVTIDQSSFTGNLAIGGNGDTGITAYGGAVWVNGASLKVTNSHFTDNHASGGDSGSGPAGRAYGGAIAWGQTDDTAAAAGLSISITGSSIDINSATGGTADNADSGGDAFGGVVDMENLNESSLSATVSNDEFRGNALRGGEGFAGGLVEGGSLAINAADAINSTFHVDHNSFNGSTATGGNSSAGPGPTAGYAGDAYGGAVSLYTGGTGQTITFNVDQVSGATAQGGSALQFDRIAATSQGADARDGGLYLDATSSDYAHLTVSGSTFNTDKAIGGAGGNYSQTGMAGGNASGGGIAVVMARSDLTEPNAAPKFTITGTTVTSSNATGGVGGSGVSPTGAQGGAGGTGGYSFGGGISLDPGNSVASLFNLTNDHLVTDTAIGGAGGHGGTGAHGFNGGNGGFGHGGVLAVTRGINGQAPVGTGTASLLRVNVKNSQFLVDHATGGNGGYGGAGLIAGIGGAGGHAAGGAVSLDGPDGGPTNLVTLDTDFLFASTAVGGTGGLGGTAIAVAGGRGGDGGMAYGGGLDTAFRGATHLLNSTILGNHSLGGNGG
jgi:hypothetical protein